MPGRILALLLIVLGVVSYFVTGMQSLTAFIPSAIGALMLAALQFGGPIKGRIIVLVLAIVGIGGTAKAIPTCIDLLGGASHERPAAIYAQTLTAVLCLVHVLTFFFDKKKAV